MRNPSRSLVPTGTNTSLKKRWGGLGDGKEVGRKGSFGSLFWGMFAEVISPEL